MDLPVQGLSLRSLTETVLMEARAAIPSLGYVEAPVCAEPESSIPKRHRSDITVGQKREICMYKLQNPAASNAGMAIHFSQLYGTSIGRSTIGDIIKRAAHWLSQSDHIVNTTRKISPRHFELEKQLYEFTTEAQGRGMKVTDEVLLRKAREIGEQIGVTADFKYSRGWLSKFKIRTKKLIYEDTSMENSIMVDVGCAEAVIQQLMGNNSQDASSGKQKHKTAKRKRPTDEAPSEPEPVSCAVCNVSLLTTHGHKHLDDIVHDYSRTPNPANALASKTVRARLEPLLEEPLDGSTWLCSMCYTTLVQLEEYNNLLALYRERHRSTAKLQRQLRQTAKQVANRGANQGDNRGDKRDAISQENETGRSSKRSKVLKQSTLLQSYMGSLGLAKQGDCTASSPGRDSATSGSEPNPQQAPPRPQSSSPSSTPSSSCSPPPPHEINLENVIKNILTQQNVNLSALSGPTDSSLHTTHLEAVISRMLEQQQQQQHTLSVSSSCSPTSSSSVPTETANKKKGSKKVGCDSVTETAPAGVDSEATGSESVSVRTRVEMETESDDSEPREPLSPVPHELDGTVDTDSVILECGLEMDCHDVDGVVDLTGRQQDDQPCLRDATETIEGFTLSHDTYSKLKHTEPIKKEEARRTLEIEHAVGDYT